MSKLLMRLVVVLLAGCGVAYAILAWTRPASVEVTTRTVHRGRVEAVVANTRAGTTRAARRSGLAPAVAGRVVELPVDEGDEVKAGQPLLTLWSKDLHAELQLARAEAEQALAAYEEVCTRAGLAQREADRARDLSITGIRSAEHLDRASSEAAALHAACRAAEAGNAVRAARIAALEARLEQHVLVAPFDGVIAEVNAELGEFVTPSPVGIPTPPAIDLFDRSSLYVEAPLDEVDAPAVRPGMPVRITLDAFRGHAFRGRVQRIAPYVVEVEKQARTVAVDVAFDDPEVLARMLPGYSADVEVVLEVRDSVLRVPTEVIYEQNRVLVYDPEDAVVREVEIEVGLRSWEYTEVVDGLSEGERIVTNIDRTRLRDGTSVTHRGDGERP